MSQNNDTRSSHQSAVPWAMACLVCVYASGLMHYLYGYYHWRIVFALPPWNAPEHVHKPLFAFFDILHLHKILFAVGAIVLAIASLQYQPRWIGIAALILAVVSLIAAIALMT